jgi:ABC-type polysaccharide/polyol phosphate export permease
MYLKKINLIYVLSIFISLVILVLPSNYKMAVYTPNILGYLWIITFPIIIACYIYLMLKKGRKKNERRKDSLIFIIFVLFTILYWIYQATRAGNLKF